jgi:hypothetical protein
MMRALGPGSVSSFLKIILDVVFFLLWGGLGLVALMMLAAIMFSFNPALIDDITIRTGAGAELAAKGPFLLGGLAAMALYLAGVLVIVERLRRIFATLTAGDPFHPDNVMRLGRRELVAAGIGDQHAGLQPDGLVLGARGLRPGRGVPRRRPPSPRSGAYDLTCRSASFSTACCSNGGCR